MKNLHQHILLFQIGLKQCVLAHKGLVLFLLISSLQGFSQQQNFPLNRTFGLTNQKTWNAYENNVHTSFLPIGAAMVKEVSLDNLSLSERQFYGINISPSDKSACRRQETHRFWAWMGQSFAYSNLLVVDTGNFYLTIDPLFNLELGKDTEDTTNNTFSRNTRGAIVRANLGNKFSFESRIYENQVFLPNYQTEYVTTTGVVAGQGRVKPFKENGFDFSSSSANLSFTPNKHLNFQLGTGKNSVGDGYRSLLLSDASFNYPFWKIIGTFGAKNQFQYTKLNASLSSTTRREKGSTSEALFARKTMSTHYFSWLATNWLHVGLFEATLWQTEDLTGTKPFNFQQFNPLIGVNTATTGFDAVNHTVVGTNLKIKLPFNAVIYNQLVYDGGAKYGYQIGAKYFGIPNVTLQAEYNNVAAYTYSSELRLQTYSNYNEALAHPVGTNFNELIAIVNYQYKRLFTQIKWNEIRSYSAASNIFISEHEVVPAVVNSISQKTSILQAQIGFIVNPKNNMNISVGINNRTENIASLGIAQKTNYIYVGFSTALRNLYNDF